LSPELYGHSGQKPRVRLQPARTGRGHPLQRAGQSRGRSRTGQDSSHRKIVVQLARAPGSGRIRYIPVGDSSGDAHLGIVSRSIFFFWRVASIALLPSGDFTCDYAVARK